MNKLIDEQKAIAICNKAIYASFDVLTKGMLMGVRDTIAELPPVEVIPVEWVESKIARLKDMDNAFASLAAGTINALLNDWRAEQNEG